MMRIGLFTILPLVVSTIQGCAGLPEKLPESAFDVPPSDAIVDAAPCTDGAQQEGTTVCGLNDEGVLMQDCTDGAWLDNDTCTGTDECVINDPPKEGTTVCGLNDEGVLMQDCPEGTWVDNDDTCTGTDECVNGAQQEGATVCGNNNSGKLKQDCTAGAWVDDNTTCTGADECVNGTSQTGTTVCGPTGENFLLQDCTNGAWVDNTTCNNTFAAECGVIGNFVAVDAGGKHTCGLSNKGTVWCWGDGQHGQLGNKLNQDSNKPVQVVWGGESQSDVPLKNITSIALGEGFGCALQGTNTVVCWGQGESGQLGNGTEASSSAPESLVGVTAAQPTVLSEIKSIAVGDHHACGLTSDQRVRCWGSNSHKQLGESSKNDSAIAINLSIQKVQSIAAGGFHTCLVGDQNRAYCWGNNNFGQLGTDNDDESSSSKIDKVEYSSPLDSWKEASKGITAGALHTCMWRVSLNESSQLGSCWGANTKGQLGFGGSYFSYLVEKMISFVEDEGFGGAMPVTAILDISAGKRHSCARQTVIDDITTICWGDNEFGQLGNGSSQSFETSPVYVNTSHSFTQISAGGAHTCGVTETGHVYCWGDNEEGQIGTGVFKGVVSSPGAAVSCPTP